jgi:hypothetical protein
LYTASGGWYGNQAGQVLFRSQTLITASAPEVQWLDTFRIQSRVNPYDLADSIKVTAGSEVVTGYGTRFIRDVQVGDSISFDTTSARVVVWVASDTKLGVSPSYGVTQKTSTYALTRRYDRSAGPPYLLSAGGFVYTGNIATHPQVIYPKEDALYIRSFGVVDSFLIDTIYNFSGRLRTIDTSAGGGDTVIEQADPFKAVWNDAVLDTGATMIDGRATWDTIPGSTGKFTRYLKGVQLVSRRKSWGYDEWRQSSTGGSEAFYVRIGSYGGSDKYNTRYFTVRGNDDSSIFLNAWYVDNGPIDSAGGQTVNWNDSLFGGHGLDLSDTLTTADLKGTWGYIMAAAGSPIPIVEDTATNTLVLLGRGAVCYTVDASFPIDTSDLMDGLYWVRLTAGDIDFPEYRNQTSRIRGIDVIDYTSGIIGSQEPTLADDDSLLFVREKFAIWTIVGNIFGRRPGERVSEWFETRAEADQAMNRGGYSRNDYIVVKTEEWHIRRGKNTFQTVDAQFLREQTAFPIRFTRKIGDTLFFVTGVSSYLNSADTATTVNWEIVQSRLPYFRQMGKLFNGEGLFGWGDTIAPTTISISPGYQPWRISALADQSVGDPTDPITAVFSYDNNIVAAKRTSLWSVTTGEELSFGIGVVGPKAWWVHDKSVYFLSGDGLYQMDRRDLSGYSIHCISRPIDPILQDWYNTEYGNGTTPVAVDQNALDKSILVYNGFDHHLWLWVALTDSTGLERALTYDIERGAWDGIQTIPIGSAVQADLRDTTRILFGSVDSAYVYGFSYVFSDAGAGIDGTIASKPFVIRDDAGRKLRSRFDNLGITYRSSSLAVDSAKITISSDGATDGTAQANVTETFTLVMTTSVKNRTKYFNSIKRLQGREWTWQIDVYGSNAGGVFFPIELEMNFSAVEDE